MDKMLFIYSPFSGGRIIPKYLDEIIHDFQNGGISIVPFRFFTNDEDALPLSMAINDDYCGIVVAGGDGTVNQVINHIIKNNIDIPLGIIPTGTCNDFVKSLGLPSDIHRAIEVIRKRDTSEIDVGLINDSMYFANTLAGGMFVNVSFNTDGDLKKTFGPFAYYMQAFNEMGTMHSSNIKITTENEIIETEALIFLVLNGKNVGGFQGVIKDARMHDGLLDILIVKACSPFDVAGLMIKLLSNNFEDEKNIISLQSSRFTIECDSEINVSVDGEKGPELPINITVCPQRVTIFTDGDIRALESAEKKLL